MKHFLSDSLHIFVIFMMVVFVIGGILAITGNFDHWTERYRLKRRRRRLLRDRRQKENMGNVSTNSTPYYSTKADKDSTNFKGYA